MDTLGREYSTVKKKSDMKTNSLISSGKVWPIAVLPQSSLETNKATIATTKAHYFN